MAWSLVALAVGAVVALLLGHVGLWVAPRRLWRLNASERPVAVVLGVALVFSLLLVGVLVVAVSPVRLGALGLIDLASVAGLCLVGLLDDLYGGSPRGLAGHFRALARGRLTTGHLKLISGVGTGLLAAIFLREELLRIVAAGFLIAAATNLWNALDVVPGRALKWGALMLAPAVAFAPPGGLSVVSGAALGAALGLLPLDLRERGMLGDAGSNPLGFVVGIAVAAIIPGDALLLAALAALGLQIAAETVTISRLIEAVPPLRWFDRLGRRS